MITDPLPNSPKLRKEKPKLRSENAKQNQPKREIKQINQKHMKSNKTPDETPASNQKPTPQHRKSETTRNKTRHTHMENLQLNKNRNNPTYKTLQVEKKMVMEQTTRMGYLPFAKKRPRDGEKREKERVVGKKTEKIEMAFE